jgi:hypothetical protein
MAKFEAGPGTGGTAQSESGQNEGVKKVTSKPTVLGGDKPFDFFAAKKVAEAKEAPAPDVEVSEGSPADAESIKGVEDAEKRARRAERGADVLKGAGEKYAAARTWLGKKASSMFSGLVSGLSRAWDWTKDNAVVGLGAAAEGKDEAAKLAGQAADRAKLEANAVGFVAKVGAEYAGAKMTEASEVVSREAAAVAWMASLGVKVAQDEAVRLGRAFLDNKYVQGAGRVAKYAAYGTGGAFALASGLGSPLWKKVDPTGYEEARTKFAAKGKFAEYAVANVSEVPGKAWKDTKDAANSAWEGVKRFFGRQRDKVVKAKDDLTAWSNAKLSEKVESMGYAKKEQVQSLADQVADLQKRLAEAEAAKKAEAATAETKVDGTPS